MRKRQGHEGKVKTKARQRPAPESALAPPQPMAPQAAVDLAGELPLLPLQSTVVFPGTLTSLQVWRDGALKLLAEYPADGTTLALVVQQDLEALDPGPDDLYQIGVAAKLVNRLNLPGNKVQVFLQGVGRIKIEQVTQTQPYFRAQVSPIVEPEPQGVRINALMGQTFARFEEMVNLSDRLPPELLNLLAINLEGPGRLADLIAYYLQFEVAEKQRILEAIDPQRRLELVMNLLNREIKLLQIQSDIAQKTSFDLEKSQREMYLRQQLEVIRRELGEDDPRGGDLKLIQGRLDAAGLPEYARREADAELARLALLSPASSEYGVVRTYLEWLYELPWNQFSTSSVDLAHARQVLDSEHEGLEQVKQRILEYLAVLKLKADLRGPILCLAGPPGVGKTSLGRSIARALGRQFVRLSVGGVRDEAEIRGHRRTYIGALPGRILQELRRAGTRNPVFMIDEVDKMGAGAQGDPAAALLEVLDPEQNWAFSDHYLGVPFDLSQVLFITTANLSDAIPWALRDRMEVIEVPSYTHREKLSIAQKFLLPKQLSAHGLKAHHLAVTASALRRIIDEYTCDAGVRNLEREVGALCRKAAWAVAAGQAERVTVDAADLSGYLGPPRFHNQVAAAQSQVGVATGLAWTAVGGVLLCIEATKMRGHGALKLTGYLGSIMQESAQAALSYLRADAKRYDIDQQFFENFDVHLHFPAGATPKDGPSAGITIAAALASLLTERPVRHDLAMTGEITLKGRVLPVGGIREKVLAGHRLGLRKLLLPADNSAELEEVPEEVRSELEIILVSHIQEVLDLALMTIVVSEQLPA